MGFLHRHSVRRIHVNYVPHDPQGSNMSDTAWAIEHSVETKATPAYAWTYMTDVKNWDDPPATFRLAGAFTSGAAGTTELPGQEIRQWRLRDVVSRDCYTVEIALDGAVVLCKWMFVEISDGHTRLTQHIALKGEKALSYSDDVQRAFEPGLGPGMSRIATAIDQAFARDTSSS